MSFILENEVMTDRAESNSGNAIILFKDVGGMKKVRKFIRENNKRSEK